MKIIKMGIKPEPKIPWWLGKKIECKKCKSILELEIEDHKKVRINGLISFVCPICGYLVKTSYFLEL